MLFNNAGIVGPVGQCWSLDRRHYRKTIDVNLNSHLYMVQEFLPAMLRMNKGHITATCSILAFLKGAHGAPNVVSKHAVKAFYDCLRNDLRKVEPKSTTATDDNIVVTSVYPGFVRTDLLGSYNFHSRAFPFLTNQLTASCAAAQIVDGALRNREHLYVAPFWRWIHTFVSMLPSALYKTAVDFVDIDPLTTRDFVTVPSPTLLVSILLLI